MVATIVPLPSLYIVRSRVSYFRFRKSVLLRWSKSEYAILGRDQKYGATNLSSGIQRPKYIIPSFTVASVGVIRVTNAERENPVESVECPTSSSGGLVRYKTEHIFFGHRGHHT